MRFKMEIQQPYSESVNITKAVKETDLSIAISEEAEINEWMDAGYIVTLTAQKEEGVTDDDF